METIDPDWIGKANDDVCLDEGPSSERQSGELGPDFQPGPTDVICERGRLSMSHEGNRLLRKHIAALVHNYANAESKLDKSLLVSVVVREIRTGSIPGHFVRRNSKGLWYDAGDAIARDKVGQGFRDMLDNKYKSSTKAKKRRRTEKLEQSFLNQANNDEPHASMTTSKPTDKSTNEADDQLLHLFQRTNQLVLERIKEGTQSDHKDLSQYQESLLVREIPDFQERYAKKTKQSHWNETTH